ncbi:MAG: hypothetical protein AB8I69_16305 [Anaerolineae bacterium]
MSGAHRPSFRSAFAWLVAMVLVTGGWTFALQGKGIVVTGQVINGSSGGVVPAVLPVTLQVFSESGQEQTAVYTTTVTTDGLFRFDGVAAVEGDMLVARAVYQDVVYTSDTVTLGSGQQEAPLFITVYETTERQPDIYITQFHMFLNRVDDRLRVGEYYLIGAAGDRTWVGKEDVDTDQRTTLAFTLPEGAQGLWFSGPGLGERFVEWEGGFADTQPIPPGATTSEVFFSYEIPYRDGVRVTRAFDAPVDSIVLLVSEAGGVTLEGEREEIAPAETLETPMGVALSYTAGPLAAGQPLVFNLVDQEAAAWNGGEWGQIVVGLFALVAAVSGAFCLWRSPVVPTLPAEANVLLEAIAALDADFEAGRVTEDAYRQERRALKRQIHGLVGSGAEAQTAVGER